MKKILIILCIIIAWMLVLCGPTKRSGEKAKAEFESRNQVVVSANTKDWEFHAKEVGDTYSEYFRFSCTPEEFSNLAGKLNLQSDPLSSLATHWERNVGEENPNQPSWWKLAPTSQLIFHKEDYSTVAHRSVMSFWYDKDSGHAFMKILFWD